MRDIMTQNIQDVLGRGEALDCAPGWGARVLGRGRGARPCAATVTHLCPATVIDSR